MHYFLLYVYVQIRLGEHDFTSTGEGSLTEITIDVASYTNHENGLPNDITIIELASEVDLNTYTPACLAKTSDTTTFDGKNAWVYGDTEKHNNYHYTENCPRLGSIVVRYRGLS